MAQRSAAGALGRSLRLGIEAAAEASVASVGGGARGLGSSLQHGPALKFRGPTSSTLRNFSNGPAASGEQPSGLQAMLARARGMLQPKAKGEGVLSAASKRGAEMRSAAYARVPKGARELVESVSRPGGLNRALSLQAAAIWDQHGRAMVGAAGVFVVYVLWKMIFGVASTFVNLSESVAEYGFLALSATCVLLGYQYMKRLNTINPDSVYRLAMLKLQMHPGVLEVMGAPLAGSTVRASVLTGGGLKFKGLVPKLRSRRLQMIFPLKGSERRGLVSIEAKKRRGKYDLKLLSVDAPTAGGGEERIFVHGNEKVYLRGSIMGELRDPFLKALSMREEYDKEDDTDDIQDEAEDKVAKDEAKAEKLRKAPKPLDQGGGMYFYEHAYWSAKSGFEKVNDAVYKWQTRNLAKTSK